MGLVYGDYGGRSDEFMPGSISFECGSKYSSYTPVLNQRLIFGNSGPPRRRLRTIQRSHRIHTTSNANLPRLNCIHV